MTWALTSPLPAWNLSCSHAPATTEMVCFIHQPTRDHSQCLKYLWNEHKNNVDMHHGLILGTLSSTGSSNVTFLGFFRIISPHIPSGDLLWPAQVLSAASFPISLPGDSTVAVNGTFRADRIRLRSLLPNGPVVMTLPITEPH